MWIISKKHYLFSVLLLAAILLLVIAWLSIKIENNRLCAAADRIRIIVQQELEKERSFLLSLTVALSQNSELSSAIINDDEELAYKTLHNATDSLFHYANLPKIYVQLITKDLFVFARSWDMDYSGFFLGEFRMDLNEAAGFEAPKVSIESGRILSFKSLAPLRHNGKLVGYLEVVHLFERMIERLSGVGLDLFVVMDPKQLEVASLMRENPTLNGYVVANRIVNRSLYERIKRVENLFDNNNLSFNDNFLVIEPMYNGVGEKLGYFVVATSTKTAKRLIKQENISFYLDFSKNEMSEVVKELDGKSEMIYTDSNKVITGEIR